MRQAPGDRQFPPFSDKAVFLEPPQNPSHSRSLLNTWMGRQNLALGVTKEWEIFPLTAVLLRLGQVLGAWEAKSGGD